MIIDLYCGAGGWAGGLELLGFPHEFTLGIDKDEDACATHSAAGFPTVVGDLAGMDPNEVLADLEWPGLMGLIASPPCQAFSLAGNGEGRKVIGQLLDHVQSCMSGWKEPPETICGEDVRADLTLQPLRWAWELDPDWIVCEQVPGVLPMWEGMEVVLRAWGYKTWSGKLSSETYGVPQTRERAILIARKPDAYGSATAPNPTHTSYNYRLPHGGRYEGTDSFDALTPWVSMADALGWGMPDRPSYTVPVGSANGSAGVEWGGASVRAELHERRESEDSEVWIPKGRVLTPGHGSNRRQHYPEEPAPTLAFGNDAANWKWDEPDEEGRVPPWIEARNDQTGESVADPDWPHDRPATTVAGRDLIADPGATSNRHNDSGKSRNDGIRVSVEQAAILQSFRADWPWRGTQTSQYRQVGNAVPPRMAAAILGQVIP